MNQPGGLARELGLWEVTLSGVGIIFGAGIYALIGVAAGEAGNAVFMRYWTNYPVGRLDNRPVTDRLGVTLLPSGPQQMRIQSNGVNFSSTVR